MVELLFTDCLYTQEKNHVNMAVNVHTKVHHSR